jgi:L-fucose isomerase-like protein
MARATLGVIIGNREFFPDHLVTEARADIAKVFRQLDIKPVMLGKNETKLGGVETYADAKKCAALFGKNRDRIQGILVLLPNFGDEKGVAETLKLSGLDVPVLIQGYPDDLRKLDVARRRDAFCGKISVCNNLDQAGIPFSLTSRHVVHPMDESFQADLLKFVAVCRVALGVRTARLGAVGARPAAFNTVRYSEKILEANGISVTTVDLSEMIGRAERLPAGDSRVKYKLNKVRTYAKSDNVPQERLSRMAKMAVILSDWMAEHELDASAIQCWTSIQENYGINICTVMSMMSENMMPSACEVDVTGALTMYAMQLASGSPSALVDWNNNYGDDEDKCVLFHCGNWARCFLPDARMSIAPIVGSTVGEENTYGTLEGRTPAGPITFGRLTTDDALGVIRAYVGEGSLTEEELDTFGSCAVAQIPSLQALMHHICTNGYEHHVAISQSHSADILAEAFETYLGWDLYYHQAPED